MSMKLLVVTLKTSLKYSFILMTKSEIQNEKYKRYLGNPMIIYLPGIGILHISYDKT